MVLFVCFRLLVCSFLLGREQASDIVALAFITGAWLGHLDRSFWEQDRTGLFDFDSILRRRTRGRSPGQARLD